LVIFVCVYFVPVHLLDVLLAIKRVGWPWWPEAVRQAMEGRQLAVGALTELIIFTLMVIALIAPVRGFFQQKTSNYIKYKKADLIFRNGLL